MKGKVIIEVDIKDSFQMNNHINTTVEEQARKDLINLHKILTTVYEHAVIELKDVLIAGVSYQAQVEINGKTYQTIHSNSNKEKE